jgi:hypothetical protein
MLANTKQTNDQNIHVERWLHMLLLLQSIYWQMGSSVTKQDMGGTYEDIFNATREGVTDTDVESSFVASNGGSPSFLHSFLQRGRKGNKINNLA